MGLDPKMVQRLKQVVARDSIAFGDVVKEYGPRVARFVVGMVRHRHDAEDIVQEVFCKVWLNISDCRDLDLFESWLFTIAYRCTLDWLAKRANQRHLSLSGTSEDETRPAYDVEDDRTPLPLDTLVGTDNAARIELACTKLTEEQYVVLRLWLADVSREDIAEIVGLKRGRQRVYEIWREIVRVLAQNTGDEQ